MKKLLYILVLVIILIPYSVLASNTKSIALVKASSQYLSITNANQTGLDFAGDYSIMGWVKFDDTSIFQHLVERYDNTAPDNGYRLYFHPLNGFVINFKSADQSTSNYGGLSEVQALEGVWFHLVVTVDVSVPTIKLYINNSEISLPNLSAGATSVGDDNPTLYVGASFSGSAQYDGKVDELSIWTKVLSTTEISDNYNSGDGQILVGNESNLVAYWRFEDDLTDETSNGNNLTNNNSASFSTDIPFSGSTPPATIKRKKQSEFWF